MEPSLDCDCEVQVSRLTQPAVKDGDNLDAASLNDRFTQFSQSGAINAFNLRDGAIDLPHFKVGTTTRFLATDMYETAIGDNRWKHSGYTTRVGQTTGAGPYAVLDSGGTANGTLSFGTLGITLTAGDLLRVYWDLSVRPRWEGSQAWEGGALYFTFPKSSGGTVNVFSGYGCWAFWLQWDITDNTLSNFVNVPGQGDFNSIVVGSRGGNALSNCNSTSIMQNVIEYGDAANNGIIADDVDYPIGWTSVDGAWHYQRPSGSVTVYGVRLVFSGPFGAYNDGATNYLVRNDSVAASARLDQQAGSIQALAMTNG